MRVRIIVEGVGWDLDMGRELMYFAAASDGTPEAREALRRLYFETDALLRNREAAGPAKGSRPGRPDLGGLAVRHDDPSVP